MDCNQTVICGNIVEISGLRFTPAGVAVTEFRLNHVSRQIEAGGLRQVECEVPAVALGQMAEIVSGTRADTAVRLTGFLAKKSRMSSQLVLHVNNIDFI
ncbi:MAG TPA: primosomal replication protein N [Nitrosospira sp.]